ncbi:hypothetical protein [Micromonospora sp. NPDC047730]|uniref:hypothetical protein n=1 Tax=Micromonospora sp. NPDC047730 TaxID=3364253 RepID=UPI003719F5FD
MTVSVVFSKATYRPDEQISFQVVVEGEPTTVTKDVTVNGSVVLPGQNTVPVTGSTRVVDDITYGAFAAEGYAVEQDPTDPSRYTATPAAA